MSTPTGPVPPLPKSKTIMGISKSTLQGTLSMLIPIFISLGALQIPAAIATPQSTHYMMWISFVASTLAGILKQIVATGQGDATS